MRSQYHPVCSSQAWILCLMNCYSSHTPRLCRLCLLCRPRVLPLLCLTDDRGDAVLEVHDGYLLYHPDMTPNVTNVKGFVAPGVPSVYQAQRYGSDESHLWTTRRRVQCMKTYRVFGKSVKALVKAFWWFVWMC
jgi:hypothetical protein